MALATNEYTCPVCGIALIGSDFDRENEYFCPYCSTDLRPTAMRSEAGSPDRPWES